jgi:hypothetical protein
MKEVDVNTNVGERNIVSNVNDRRSESGKKEKKDETNVLLKNFSFVCIYTSMAETLRQIQTWGRIHNTLCSSQLTNEPNKLDCLSVASLYSLV